MPVVCAVLHSSIFLRNLLCNSCRVSYSLQEWDMFHSHKNQRIKFYFMRKVLARRQQGFQKHITYCRAATSSLNSIRSNTSLSWKWFSVLRTEEPFERFAQVTSRILTRITSSTAGSAVRRRVCPSTAQLTRGHEYDPAAGWRRSRTRTCLCWERQAVVHTGFRRFKTAGIASNLLIKWRRSGWNFVSDDDRFRRHGVRSVRFSHHGKVTIFVLLSRQSP